MKFTLIKSEQTFLFDFAGMIDRKKSWIKSGTSTIVYDWCIANQTDWNNLTNVDLTLGQRRMTVSVMTLTAMFMIDNLELIYERSWFYCLVLL